MAKVILYSKDWCPFCVQAKTLLSQRGIEFEEINIESWGPEKFRELINRSGMRTVPQIFYGDQLIGGFQELSERDRTQGLDDLRG